MSSLRASAGKGAWRGNLILAATAIALTLIMVEGSLRALLPEPTGYYVFAPQSLVTTEPVTELMPGVEGAAEFRTNAHGIRGEELGPDGSEYRILTFGGSTAQNVYLDQSESWPLLLGSLLGPTADGRRTWAGSVGRSGATARTNLVQFRYLIPSIPRMDLAVLLLGVNDLGTALRQEWAYEPPAPISDPEAERLQMPQAFLRVPGSFLGAAQDGVSVPFYKRSALWSVGRLARDAWVARTGGFRQDRFGETLVTWRAHRQQSPVIHDSLPSLVEPLAEYRGYVEEILDLAEDYGIRVVLVTQPALWRHDLGAHERALLWMGGAGDFQSRPGQAYFSPGALADAMHAYNRVLLDVCRTRSVECVDLAAAVPADTTMFYDDVHPTERGSRLFAEVLAEHLRRRAPYVP